MNRTLLALVVGTGLVGAPAAIRADEVDALGGKVSEIDARVYEMNGKLKPPPDPGPEIAERRLIDAQVLYELKNYEDASIILFDVVEKYSNSAAYPEALFYLADSLYLKRDYLSSRRFFEKIIEVGPVNPRYQESLQRLIELSLHTGDYSPVDGYIAKLEGLSVDKQLPSVPYVKGKYYYFRRQFDKAIEALKGIGPTHVYYFHALYFVGAANVAMGMTQPEKLEDALQAYGTILKAEPKTDSQRLITELSHMAMARIFMERGQMIQALEEYSKISQKSDQFNDMLYESAWVAIKGKDYVKARRQLDLLLLNAPDSPLAPEVKLLIGSLHVRQAEYGPATDAFTKTRDEFEPLQKMLEEELKKTGDAPSYFKDLIAKNLAKFDITVVLPSAAVKWVKDEQEVARVASLVNDEAELKRSLEESEDIVKRLERVLNGPQRVNVFPELASARAKATEYSNEITEVKKQLAQREAALIAPAAGAQKATLDALEQERSALESKLALLPSKAASVAERQNKARATFNELDKRASELQVGATNVKQSVTAARKLYEDEQRKQGKPITQVGNAGSLGAPEASPPTGSYAERVAELDRRLKATDELIAKTRARTDKLKDLVLKDPMNAKNEIDGCSVDIDSVQHDLDVVRRDLLEAATTVGVGDSDMQASEQLKAQYEDVLKRQHDLSVEVKSRLGGNERGKVDQLESILDRARGVDQKIGAFNARIDEFADAKLKDILSTLGDEKAHVVAYRETLGGYTNESTDVGGVVIADNFKAVALRFYNVVVRSDVGIIDVAWALKDSSTRETNRLVAERKRELKLLDDEFKEVLKEQP